MSHDIPKSLHCYSTGAPFTHCIDCNSYLLDNGQTYFIEKAIRQYNNEGYSAKEVLFEYAMCLKCAERIKAEMSTESRFAMESYMMQNSSIATLNNEDLHCMIKGESIEKYSEYQVFSMCQGNTMLTQQPMALGADALEELSALISLETKGEWDRMMGDFFGTPPELEALLPNHRMPLII
jgi:hypothetical protein